MGKFSSFLAETDLFYNLTPAQLELIDSIATEQAYQKDEMIFQENSHQKELYLILEGEVDILLNPTLVTSQPLLGEAYKAIATLRRGECFGEIALVDEGVRSAAARASTRHTRLLSIPRTRLLMLCDSYPEMGYLIMRNLAAALGQKIRLSNMNVREEMLYQKQPGAQADKK